MAQTLALGGTHIANGGTFRESPNTNNIPISLKLVLEVAGRYTESLTTDPVATLMAIISGIALW